MAKKKEVKPAFEKHEIAGHSIQIRKEGKVEQLFIDGIPQKFFERNGLYALYANVYAVPQKTLLEAVKIYFGEHPKRVTQNKGGKNVL